MPVTTSSNFGFPIPGATTSDSRLGDIQAIKAALTHIDGDMQTIEQGATTKAAAAQAAAVAAAAQDATDKAAAAQSAATAQAATDATAKANAAKAEAIAASSSAFPVALSSFTNDTGFQTVADVAAAINAVVGAAPAALDTLQEIGAALQQEGDAIVALTTAIASKSEQGHLHVASDIQGLQAVLNGKADELHTHTITDVTGLQAALDDKAEASHGHNIADVAGLQSALTGKADVATLAAKQDVLVSGDTIKTINGVTVLGSGDITTPAAQYIGEIRQIGFSTVPAGWLLCDGSDVSRATYPLLFATIGTSYGEGDGTSTFGVPDFRGAAPLGSGTEPGGSTFTLGDNYGTVSGAPGASVLTGGGAGNQLNAVAVNFIIAATAASIGTDGTAILSGISGLTSVIAAKADQATTYTKTETNAAIQAVVGAAPAALDTLQEIATQLASDESAVAALVSTVALKADTTYVDAQLAGKGTSNFSGAYADLTGKPVIPTAVSSFTNDSGYQTAAQVSAAVASKADQATTVTLDGAQTLTNKALTAPVLTGAKEVKGAMPANNIDLATGNFFTKTISGATTLTVSNIPTAGTAASFILDLTNGGSASITWWSGVKWAAGTAPTLTVSGVDNLGFYTHDGGVTWRGLLLAGDSK